MTVKLATLDCLAPLLAVLRGHPALREVRPTEFHLDGRDFVHFHETPDGIFADVRLSKGQIRVSVSTQAEQSELLDRMESTLEALLQHSSSEKTPKRKRRGGLISPTESRDILRR